jgi:hypothetical protein
MGGETSLFDLSADIGEGKDLKAEKPEVLEELEKDFEQWSSQMAEPLWGGQQRKPRSPRKAKAGATKRGQKS